MLQEEIKQSIWVILLWSYCTTFKTPLDTCPYQIVCGKACHSPLKLEHKALWVLKSLRFDFAKSREYSNYLTP